MLHLDKVTLTVLNAYVGIYESTLMLPFTPMIPKFPITLSWNIRLSLGL